VSTSSSSSAASDPKSAALTSQLAPLRPGDALPKELAQSIATAITGLEFGSVEITIHNSRVVQIERHERIRFQSPGDSKGRG
jgi:hypothetical protein